MTRPFLERLDRHSRLDKLDECFPFQVLSVEASVLEFYRFYGIESTQPRHPADALHVQLMANVDQTRTSMPVLQQFLPDSKSSDFEFGES